MYYLFPIKHDPLVVSEIQEGKQTYIIAVSKNIHPRELDGEDIDNDCVLIHSYQNTVITEDNLKEALNYYKWFFSSSKTGTEDVMIVS